MDQQPIQDNQNYSNKNNFDQKNNDQPEAADLPTTPLIQPVINKKKLWRKALFLALIALLIVAIGTSIYLFLIKKDSTGLEKSSNSTNAKEQTNESKKIISLIYAYKEGKKVTVRSIKLSDKSKSELFSYTEEYEPNKLDFNRDINNPNIDRNNNGEFVYFADNGIFIGKNGAITQKVKRTIVSAGVQANFEPNFEFPTPKEGPGGPYSVYAPKWTDDNASITFEAMYQEGASIAQYVLATSKLNVLGNTFTYISPSHNGSTSLKIDGSPMLPKLNYGENHFFRYNGVHADFTPGGATAAAVLCQPVTNDFDFSDCTKNPKKLVSIDTKTGAVTVLSEGSYDRVAVASMDSWYVINKAGGTNVISLFVPSTKTMTSIDLSTALKDQGEVLEARVIPGNPMIAEIYTKKPSGLAVVVVNLDDKQQIATFDIAEASAFKVLGTEQ